jgi:BirA family biotin operon repressor/biotin-[acetyl-CoA-carboxylase] ligase
MEYGAALARSGARERTVVVAAEQTAGRGRGGRAWQAPAGSGLFCTAILRPSVMPERLSTLPLVIGVAVAEALETLSGIAVRLKWPNDLWIGADLARQKVAGVLVTSRLDGGEIDAVLIGIGVNLSAAHAELPPGATSLLAATGCRVTPDQLLDRLLPRLDAHYAAWLAAAGRPSLDRWRARAALLGEAVSVIEHEREFVGTFAGIDDDGALLLRGDDLRLRRIVAGDLVRGPRSANQDPDGRSTSPLA